MAVETFPEFAINLIYTVLCLVPGFITLKSVQFYCDFDFELDKFDKTTWSLIGSGMSLSVLYYVYVVWTAVTTGRFALVVPLDLKWTQLVAAYPLLLGVSVIVGYLIGRLIRRFGMSPDGMFSAPGQEQTSD